MLAFLFSFDTDRDVHVFQMALAFNIRKKKTPFHYDFAEII